jgi:hypothetical protein
MPNTDGLVTGQTLGSATSPYVRTSYSYAQNLSADAETAMFPYLLRPQVGHAEQPVAESGLNDWAGLHYKQGSIVALNRNHSPNTRTQWVSLPIEEFGDSSSGTNVTGLLMELPWLNGSRVAIACSMAAAWHNGTVRSEWSENYDALSIIIHTSDGGFADDSPTNELTNDPVTWSDDWLALLTVPSPGRASSADNSSLNTLESILTDSFYANLTQDLRERPGFCGKGAFNKTELSLSDAERWAHPQCAVVGHDYIETILATMVADGVSRYDSHRAVNTTGELRQWRALEVASFNRTHVFAKDDLHTSATTTAGLTPQ